MQYSSGVYIKDTMTKVKQTFCRNKCRMDTYIRELHRNDDHRRISGTKKQLDRHWTKSITQKLPHKFNELHGEFLQACYDGDLEKVMMLFKTVDINIHVASDYVFVTACINNKFDVAEYLLSLQNQIHDVQNTNRCVVTGTIDIFCHRGFLFHHAHTTKNQQLIDWLIALKPFLTVPIETLNLVFQEAIDDENLFVIEIVYLFNNDIKIRSDDDTEFNMAVLKKNADICQWLIDHNTMETKPYIIDRSTFDTMFFEREYEKIDMLRQRHFFHLDNFIKSNCKFLYCCEKHDYKKNSYLRGTTLIWLWKYKECCIDTFIKLCEYNVISKCIEFMVQIVRMKQQDTRLTEQISAEQYAEYVFNYLLETNIDNAIKFLKMIQQYEISLLQYISLSEITSSIALKIVTQSKNLPIDGFASVCENCSDDSLVMMFYYWCMKQRTDKAHQIFNCEIEKRSINPLNDEWFSKYGPQLSEMSLYKSSLCCAQYVSGNMLMTYVFYSTLCEQKNKPDKIMFNKPNKITFNNFLFVCENILINMKKCSYDYLKDSVNCISIDNILDQINLRCDFIFQGLLFCNIALCNTTIVEEIIKMAIQHKLMINLKFDECVAFSNAITNNKFGANNLYDWGMYFVETEKDKYKNVYIESYMDVILPQMILNKNAKYVELYVSIRGTKGFEIQHTKYNRQFHDSHLYCGRIADRDDQCRKIIDAIEQFM